MVVMDGGEIDVWKRTDSDSIDTIICTVDLLKRDIIVKPLERQLTLCEDFRFPARSRSDIHSNIKV